MKENLEDFGKPCEYFGDKWYIKKVINTKYSFSTLK